MADAVSRMALSGSGGGLTVNTMLRWSIDGARTGWGEDQEVWSLPTRREHEQAHAVR